MLRALVGLELGCYMHLEVDMGGHDVLQPCYCLAHGYSQSCCTHFVLEVDLGGCGVIKAVHTHGLLALIQPGVDVVPGVLGLGLPTMRGQGGAGGQGG